MGILAHGVSINHHKIIFLPSLELTGPTNDRQILASNSRQKLETLTNWLEVIGSLVLISDTQNQLLDNV